MSLFFVHIGSACIDFPLSLIFLLNFVPWNLLIITQKHPLIYTPILKKGDFTAATMIEDNIEQHKVGEHLPVNKRRQPNVGLLLGQHCRRCANSNATLGQ